MLVNAQKTNLSKGFGFSFCRNQNENCYKYFEAGMNDYIRKPVNIQEIIRVISQSQSLL